MAVRFHGALLARKSGLSTFPVKKWKLHARALASPSTLTSCLRNGRAMQLIHFNQERASPVNSILSTAFRPELVRPSACVHPLAGGMVSKVIRMNANSSERSTVQVEDNDGPLRTADSAICVSLKTRSALRLHRRFARRKAKAISGYLLLDGRMPGFIALKQEPIAFSTPGREKAKDALIAMSIFNAKTLQEIFPHVVSP
jgi:hypothetical protein